ncbi:MAG TPA: hypothetical protein DEB06_10580 [Phycisphaerales bacterium]|nr:hypothetical protein [Phycisphaerales bacterium]
MVTSSVALWFDAHLDLAYLAVGGREMRAPLDPAMGPHAPASITLPSLREGGVRVALATVFTEAVANPGEVRERSQYPAGDAERANAVGRAQLEVYLTWRDEGLIAIDVPRVLRADPGLGEIRGGMGVAEVRAPALDSLLARARNRAPLHVGILMENADPIRTPDELPWWVERGVCAIGLCWARASRYASGNATPPDQERGLTDLGRAMSRTMDALGVVHDLSHLSDRATDDLLAFTDRPVIASHSNSRAVLNDPTNQRHLRDETVREIARRGGVIGLNLIRNFIAPQPYASADPRPSVERALDHVEHICAIAGHRRCVGLGSDMDGGISAHDLPAGIERPSGLALLSAALRSRGWSAEEVAGFEHANFARFFAGAGER